MIVNMPNKEGVTLATQGKYCKENIEVVPTYKTTFAEYIEGTKKDITAKDLAGVTEIKCGMINNTNITSLELSDTVTTIGGAVFQGCKNIASITLPDHPIHFVTNAFAGGANVERTVYITNLDTWCRHSFDNGHSHPFVGTSGHLYLNNEKVTELVIPDTITFLGNAAFYNCVDLTSVIIHDRVTVCNAWTFNGCTNLKTVSIGNGMQRLNDAFGGCISLMKITCLAETPPVLNSVGLNKVPADCIIEVPAASVEAYKAAPNWIARADYIVAIEE